jgi:uncharacterized protein
VIVLDPAEVPAVPWRNGAGVTRELWSGEGVRVSVADLTEDAPFSHFPGVDRLFVPLRRAVTLVVDGRVVTVGPHRALAFAGEAHVATRGLGAPTRALNVMTTRGKCQATVRVVGRDVDPGADVTLAVHLGAHRADIRLVPAPPASSS